MTHTDHYSDSGILISDDMTRYEERQTVILGSDNKLSYTSGVKKITSLCVEEEISTAHPKAPPTNVVCGHFNTVVIRC